MLQRTVLVEPQVAAQSAGEAAAQGQAQTDSRRRLRGVVGRLRERAEQPADHSWMQAGPWSRTVSASHRPAGATSRWMRRSVAPPAYLTALSTRFDRI